MVTSRFRTQSEPNVMGSHTIDYYNWPSSIANHSDLHLVGCPYKKSTTDVVTKDFKKRSAQGEVFNNPFSSTSEWIAGSGSYYSSSSRLTANGAPDPLNGYQVHQWHGGAGLTFVPELPEPVIDISDFLAQAKTQAAGAVNSSDINTLVTAAELHKTKVLHRQVGQALLDLFKGLYQKNVGRATSKALSNAWLTGRYGVLPTLYELEGALKLLQRKVSARYTARGFASHTVTSSDNYYVPDSAGFTFRVSRSVTKEVSIRTGILYETSEILRVFGKMGLTRPLSAGYELIKFSWVLDWWIDVGGWLDAIQPDGSSKHLAAWEGYRERITWVRKVEDYVQNLSAYDAPQHMSRSWDEQLVHVIERKVRSPWSGSLPNTPPLGRGLNSLRCADLVSLLVQKLNFRGGGNVRGIRF